MLALVAGLEGGDEKFVALQTFRLVRCRRSNILDSKRVVALCRHRA